MHWLAHALGLDNAAGHVYLFWSGFGSDISEFALIGAAWHMFNCHDEGCPRLGRHVQVTTEGHHVRRCHKHHQQACLPQ